ncbi:hypothetical protein LEP1GSC021_1424 [Leptospira noguchii str. 1993005606]|nr:hypothetical protein LEP1GSC021_1424 [Leptospira noguchii str. 1993005606]
MVSIHSSLKEEIKREKTGLKVGGHLVSIHSSLKEEIKLWEIFGKEMMKSFNPLFSKRRD